MFDGLFSKGRERERKREKGIDLEIERDEGG